MHPLVVLGLEVAGGLTPCGKASQRLFSLCQGPQYTITLAEALFGTLMGTLEFGLSSGDDEVMGASVDALAVLARHQVASLEAGRQGLRPTASSGACAG